MWAAWTSSFSSTSTNDAPTGGVEASSSVASVLASSPSAVSPSSQFPQWRLLATMSRRLSNTWHRLLSFSSASSRQRIVVGAAAAAAVVSTLAGAIVVARNARRHGGSHSTVSTTGEEMDQDCTAAQGNTATIQQDDAIEFADPAESAFNAYLRRIQKQKESVLRRALAQLESASAELKAAQDAAAVGIVSSNVANRGASETNDAVQLQAKVHRAAVVADELLTQWICSLDGLPVRQREGLRQRRKELIENAAGLHQRIAPYLNSAHPA
ncbi:hypothetical protein NQL31_005592 [Lotmaria passim]